MVTATTTGSMISAREIMEGISVAPGSTGGMIAAMGRMIASTIVTMTTADLPKISTAMATTMTTDLTTDTIIVIIGIIGSMITAVLPSSSTCAPRNPSSAP